MIRMLAPTARFSDRVADYVRWRPSYPIEVVRTLEREAHVAPSKTRVVDLGCGTGISSALFLREGYAVTGVEPNQEMRAAGEELLASHPAFRVVPGTAEATGLPDASCDLVIAAQAFHWFDESACRAEVARILVPDGIVALFWNDRRTDVTPFLREYEEILLRFGTDYRKVVHRNVSDDDIAAFFGSAGCERRVFANHQDFDRVGLLGRALSSSYVPREGLPGHPEIMAALGAAFDHHARDGRVRFEYDTRLYFGRLSPQLPHTSRSK
jgi:SAM-dependent methyltransferase